MKRSSRLRVRAVLVVIAVVALLGTACSDPGEELTTTGSPGGGDTPLFVIIEIGGGFVPQGYDFRQPPNALIYSDGSAFGPGAITLQYPGPAVLPVFRTKATKAQLDEILAAAEEAGLTRGDKRDYGEPPVADAPNTTITVVADGKTHVTSIYALDIESPPQPEGEPESQPFVSPDAEEARRQAQEFVKLVGSVVTGGESTDYEPARYRVLPFPIDLNAPPPGPEAGVEAPPKDWPFPQISLVANECVVVGGSDAPTFRDALRDANEITKWRPPSDELYTLAVRPVLPHEPDCPEEPKPDSP